MAPAEKNPGGRKNTRNSGKNIASRVREAVTKPVEDAGYSIWDVTYYKDVSEMVLEIAIDRKADGTPIGTDDCENVTKIVEPILDEMDPIEGSYSLMVSGGGIVRDLRTDEHLDYAIRNGYSVLFRTFTAAAAEDAPSDPKEKTSGGQSGR
ncbi:MAG: hypothetical protein ILO68_07575 [Clostridia bacterium]|nr:hypothetical protein [Clostridia bacterium]